MYQSDCICKVNYICMTEPDVIMHWNEHNNPKPDSEPTQLLENNLSYNSNWFIVTDVSVNQGKNRE